MSSLWDNLPNNFIDMADNIMVEEYNKMFIMLIQYHTWWWRGDGKIWYCHDNNYIKIYRTYPEYSHLKLIFMAVLVFQYVFCGIVISIHVSSAILMCCALSSKLLELQHWHLFLFRKIVLIWFLLQVGLCGSRQKSTGPIITWQNRSPDIHEGPRGPGS